MTWTGEGADPDAVLLGVDNGAGVVGRYVPPPAADLRVGATAGAGAFAVTGTLVLIASPATLAGLNGTQQCVKDALDGQYETFGEDIVIHRSVPGEYSTTTGKRAVTTTHIVARAIVSSFAIDEIVASQGLIVQGDLKIKVCVNDLLTAMSTRDVIECQDQIFKVVNIDPARGRIGTAQYEYHCQARR